MKLIKAILILTFFAVTSFADVADIYNKTGVKGGFVVHVGCGDPSTGSGQVGKLTAALRINDSFLVQGLDKDAANVDAARKYVNSKGIYGDVSVNQFDGKNLPYADNVVNMIVASGENKISKEEVLRVLAPRGVALVDGKKIVKPVPSDIGEWTHYLHGPDNNAVSKDTKVGFPKHIQWQAYPAWGRHHATAQGVEAVVSTKGRIFYIIDDAEASIGDTLPDKWNLVARDAFSGVQLWKKPLSNFSWKMWTSGSHEDGRMGYPKQRHRRLVALGDRVYITLGLEAPVSIIDAATGNIIKTLKGTEHSGEVILYKDILYLAIRTGKREEARYNIIAVNPETEKVLWKSESYKGYPGQYPGYADLSLIVGDKYVAFQDEEAVVCLDIKNGKERWQSTSSYSFDSAVSATSQSSSAENASKIKKLKEKLEKRLESNKGDEKADQIKQLKSKLEKLEKGGEGIPKYKKGGFCRLIYHDGVVYLLNPYAAPNLSAISAETGKTLWQGQKPIIVYGTSSQMFVAQNLLWAWEDGATLGGLDLKTGSVEKKIDITDARKASIGHIRCYPEKGTENTLWTTLSGKDQQIINLESGEISSMPWLRGACRIGILPCNGLLYMTPHPCMCHAEMKLKGFMALASEQKAEGRGRSAGRLVKGPAFGKASVGKGASSEDWPMLRNNGTRENHSVTTIGNSLKMEWEAEIKGKLTQPVIASGMVYLAAVDEHTVYALDEKTGKQVWSYIADSRVDSPPTYYKGRVLFGSADGHVYCLVAKDGKLAWKFRVAPGERNVVVRGRIESTWPVHGSVLVHNDKIVVVAGRSSYIDGGIFITILDPDTGAILKKSSIDTTGLKLTTADDNEDKAPGSLTDVLVAKNNSVYMSYYELSLNDAEIKALGSGSVILKGGPGQASHAKKGSMFITGSGGMLHEGFFHRSGIMYGKSIGQVLAVDGNYAYDVKLFPNWSDHNGPTFVHGKDKVKLVKEDPVEGGIKWSVDIPQIARALISVGDKVVVGGAPEEIDTKDPWKGYEGRGNGEIYIYSKEDGSTLGKCELSSVPVGDGISAANKKLFVSLKNGKVQCWK